jgi:integrase
MAQHLTDTVVKKLPAPDHGSKVHYDAGARGFGISVTTTGTRSFILNYRVRGTGRERRITIGRYPVWTTTAAREEARRLRRQIDDGADPLASIEAEREAPTVAELIDRFLAEHVGPRLRPNTVRHYKMLIRRHVRPHFGTHTKVAEVDFEHIDALHRKVTKAAGPYAANRVAQVLSKMFSLSVRWKMRPDNPVKGVEHNYEEKRKRYLSGDELARLTAALATYPQQQSANVIRFLLLTGCRRFEAMSARWDGIDLTTGIWTKLGSSTKQKSDHTVPLSAPARQLLSEIHTQQAPGPWVFPSNKGKTGHVVELATAWEAICKAAGITGLRVHDLRHSFASQLASGGASLPLIGALLGHSNPATTSRYAHLFQDPQRAAVERVGAIVDAAGKDASETVKAFPKGGRHGNR